MLDYQTTPRVSPAPLPAMSRDQVCLVGAKDAFHTSYAGLADIEVPKATYRDNKTKEQTVSYQPVPYQDFADATRSIFAEALNLEPISESYALACKGQQMFGKIVFPWDDRRGLAIALRSSYDKTIANQVAGGLNTFICANGMLSGEAMISLKHTLNVYERLPQMIRDMASRAGATARQLTERLDAWERVPCHDDAFYAYVGILQGRGIVTAHIASAARSYWAACRDGDLHDEHGVPNLANAFQAVSGGLQRGAPRRAFQDFGGVDFVTDRIAQAGGSMHDAHIPAWDLTIEEF